MSPVFASPVETARPRGASRIEVWGPRVGRDEYRCTIAMRCAYGRSLESDPRVTGYCERPAYWERDEGRLLADFWVARASREEILVLERGTEGSAEVTKAKARRGGMLSPRVMPRRVMPRRVMRVPVGLLDANAQWIENWLRILPYLSANARWVDERLTADVKKAMGSAATLGVIERQLNPLDIVLIRTAVFRLLHQGAVTSDGLRRSSLGPRTAFASARRAAP
jgi:hypothetical protein